MFPDCSPIFVVGSGRSGTTLLQLMLNQHPRLSITGELHFFDQILGLRRFVPTLAVSQHIDRLFDFLPKTHGLKFLTGTEGFDEVLRTAKRKMKASDAPSYELLYKLVMAGFAERKGATRFGEKSNLAYLDELVQIFPKCKIIHIVRDPRANVASRLKVPWTSDDVITNAVKWGMEVSCVRRFASQGHEKELLELRYEQLVIDPIATLRNICDFLEEDFHDSMMTYYESATRYVNSEPWKHGTLKPVYRSAMEGWRSELSQGQVWLIERITRGVMLHYGYELSSFSWQTSLRSALQIFREMSRWVAFKIRERRERQGELVFSNRAKLLQMLWQFVAGR